MVRGGGLGLSLDPSLKSGAEQLCNRVLWNTVVEFNNETAFKRLEYLFARDTPRSGIASVILSIILSSEMLLALFDGIKIIYRKKRRVVPATHLYVKKSSENKPGKLKAKVNTGVYKNTINYFLTPLTLHLQAIFFSDL